MELVNSFADYSKTIQEWLIDFRQAENIDPAYRDALHVVLSRLWLSAAIEGEEKSDQVSLLTLPHVLLFSPGK